MRCPRADPAKFLDIEMDKLARVLALITRIGSAVSSAASLFSQSRRRMRLTVAGEIPTSAAICLPEWRCRRKASTAARVAGWVWLGDERGP